MLFESADKAENGPCLAEFVFFSLQLNILVGNGAFSLPDTETDTETETDTDTDKLTQNPMGISVDVCLCAI